MAFVVLKSLITIGGFQFSGVHEVRVLRGMHGLTTACTIKLPSKARIDGPTPTLPDGEGVVVDERGFVTTGNLFADGDAVKVELGYDDDLQTEFEGYIKRRNLAMPLEIECEGYERELRLAVNINRYYPKTTAKELLTDVCSQTSINVICDVDFPLVGMRLVDCDGIEVINHIKKCSENALTIFFIAPRTLWCGLVYTPYIGGNAVMNLPRVAYDLGYNCIKDNNLKERTPKEKVQVFMNGVLASGDGVRTQSKDVSARRKARHYLNNVPDKSALQLFADEVANRMNYTGYAGNVTGFLQPYCLPGYVATVYDARYPALKGDYLVESTEVTFGMGGGRRRVGLGVKLG